MTCCSSLLAETRDFFTFNLFGFLSELWSGSLRFILFASDTYWIPPPTLNYKSSVKIVMNFFYWYINSLFWNSGVILIASRESHNSKKMHYKRETYSLPWQFWDEVFHKKNYTKKNFIVSLILKLIAHFISLPKCVWEYTYVHTRICIFSSSYLSFHFILYSYFPEIALNPFRS